MSTATEDRPVITLRRDFYSETVRARPDWLYLATGAHVRPPSTAEAEAYALRHHDARWADLYPQSPEAAESAQEPAKAGDDATPAAEADSTPAASEDAPAGEDAPAHGSDVNS